MTYDDDVPEDHPGDKYNITKERALNSWNKHKDFYNQFDCVITSDTAPISRVFLQNDWRKPLIVWICNRFDYSCQPSRKFPDQGYYQLLKEATKQPNVRFVGYTPFEMYYAQHIRHMPFDNTCIKPIGSPQLERPLDLPSDAVDAYYVGPYHNDNNMLNLAELLRKRGVNVLQGRYRGPHDLARYKGVIHIPYAWSNLAFFEAIQHGIVYFVPSMSFLRQLACNSNFFWSPPYVPDAIALAEWYQPAHKDLLIYFDSWDDLLTKMQTLDIVEQKQRLRTFAQRHTQAMLKKWNALFHVLM